MNKLPQELLPLIIQHLEKQDDRYTCTLVDKRFYQAAIPLLWEAADLFSNEPAQTFLTCLTMSQHHHIGRHIRALSVNNCVWTDTEFLSVIEHTRWLEDLQLINLKHITDTSLQHLGRHCPRLRILILYHMDISQPSMDALGQHCYQLTELTVANCWKLGPDTFSAVIDGCPLEMLHIEYPSLGLITDKVAMDLANHFDRLTELELMYLPIGFIERLLSAAATAAGSWPHLTHLTINNYDVNYQGNGGDGALVPFLQTHPGLQVLDLNQSQFNLKLLKAISAIHHPKLMDLHLQRVRRLKDNGAVLRQLVRDCPMLCYISLDVCMVPSSSFPEAGTACISQRYHNMLQYLDHEAITKIRLAG
ncbi:hypothetical protein BCR42DRAFT_442878 [Absidia repens]|uniref:F-box domain-containing protein n=1 Tax=Absidia repens TaxID=90262 RepID=A0A1X2I1B2_9FUNG|nr:hypothetical protein BCR42DRAFT_442878 [Absidia repens]